MSGNRRELTIAINHRITKRIIKIFPDFCADWDETSKMRWFDEFAKVLERIERLPR